MIKIHLLSESLFQHLISLVTWPLFLIVLILNEIVRFIFYLLLIPSRYRLIQSGNSNIFRSPSFSSPYFLLGLYSKEELTLPKETVQFKIRILQRSNEKGELLYSQLYKRLTQKWGYACLRDDKDTIFFDVKNHIKIYPTQKVLVPESELCSEILPSLQSKNDDVPDKPQWELFLLPKVKRADGSIDSLRLLRIHGSYMNPQQAFLLLRDLCCDPSTQKPRKSNQWGDPEPSISIQSDCPRNGPSLIENLGKWDQALLAFCAIYCVPYFFLRRTWAAMSACFRRSPSNAVNEASEATSTLFKEPRTFELPPLKKVVRTENRLKTDINVASVFATGLHLALQQRSPMTEDTLTYVVKSLNLPNGQFSSTISLSSLSWNKLVPDSVWGIYASSVYASMIGRFPLKIMNTLWPGAVNLNQGGSIAFSTYDFGADHLEFVKERRLTNVVYWPSQVNDHGGVQATFVTLLDQVTLTLTSLSCLFKSPEEFSLFATSFFTIVENICRIYCQPKEANGNKRPTTPRLSLALPRFYQMENNVLSEEAEAEAPQTSPNRLTPTP